MWPMKLDMTKEECRGVLRRLELESYGTLISTFRAQGLLCKEKLRLLDDLRRILHISNDRHRAEARRVANDERLYTVAEIIYGPNSAQGWRHEGHRAFPILPRSVPHTALTYIANTVYEQLTRANCKLAHPASTSCDRLKKAEEMFRFDLVRRELSLFEKGLERDAAVVTSDPLQDIMSKSYINNDVKRSEESKPEESGKDEASIPDTEKNTDGPAPVPATANEQPSLSDILLDNSSSPSVSSSTANKPTEKPSKTSERSRKKSQGTKRQGKVKSPYPAGKPSKNGPANNAKQSSKVSSTPSPHLMHSYAVPFDFVSATNGGNTSPEPLQLQQHLTSNMTYPGHYGYMGHNAVLFPGPFFGPKATTPLQPGPNFKHQQGILPSSKKDIQYNLSKLNPTNSASMKGNVNIPLWGAGTHPGAKALPQLLLNYQKKANSKNILIPTSTSAATLASLGLPLNEQTSDWIASKYRAAHMKPLKMYPPPSPPPDAPDARVSFTPPPAISSAPEEPHERRAVPSVGSKSSSSAAGPDPPVLLPHSAANSVPSTSTPAHTRLEGNAPETTTVVGGQALASPVVGSGVLPLKQPTIVGFTPVKSGSKLSVSKTQLMPLGPSVPVAHQVSGVTAGGAKSNVFILPKSSTPAMLNLGQKISLTKCIVDPTAAVAATAPPSVTRSPPKVIVQPVPSLNNLPSFEINPEQKAASQFRQLFTAEKLSSDAAQATTPMEIARGIVRPAESSQPQLRSGPVDGGIPPPSVQPQLPSSGPTESAPPVRKITISTSQLLPFKGILHGNALQGSSIVTKTVPRSAAIVNERTTNSATPVPPANTDWEQEMDREIGHDALVSPPNLSVDGKPSREAENQHNRNPPNALFRAISTSSSVGNDGVDLGPRGEYDPISADRGDDSSATDSADAEEDPEDEPTTIGEHDDIEEDDYADEHTIDVETDPNAIIIEEDETNYDSLIEEVIEEDNYIEEIVDEQMDIAYDSSRDLVTEMENTSEHIIEEHPNMNGIETEPSEIHFVHCGDMIADEMIENGDTHEEPSHSAKDDIVCELLEIDADGTYSTRQFSYEQAIAEGLTVLPTKAKPQKANRSIL